MHLPVWNVEHVENLVGVLVLNDAGSNPDRITLAQLVSYLYSRTSVIRPPMSKASQKPIWISE